MKSQLEAIAAAAQAETEQPPAPAPQEPPEAKLPRNCINCGQDWIPIEIIGAENAGDKPVKHYKCPACVHLWTDAEEAAPFRNQTSGSTAPPVDPIAYGDWPTIAERLG